MPITAAAAGTGRHVLVVFSNARLLPANVEADRSFRETLHAAIPDAEISTEFLDYPRFSGTDHVDNLKAYVKRKYGERPPDVVVAAGGDALRFLLQNHADMFPAAPLVHMGVLASQLDAGSETKATGVPIDLQAGLTLEDALRLHPRVEQVVVVTGASPIDRGLERQVRSDLKRIADKTRVIYLAGLPTSALMQRLAELDDRSLIFTPGYFQDGEGRDSFPRDTVNLMAQSVNAPIYAPFDTFIGAGIVGGHMVSFHDVGELGAKIVTQLFLRGNMDELNLPKSMPTRLQVDWRQVLRWNVDPALLPTSAVTHFRPPDPEETHYQEVLIAFGVVSLQAVLISLLLFERHRRHHTEVALQKHRFELAHASRLAIAGELTGSIAHEINQPLSAILSNAAAAELMLEAGTHDPEALKEILKDIRRDDLRASQVIKRLRALLQKHETDHAPVDLNSVLNDISEMLRAEVQRRNLTLVVIPAPVPAEILGDRVQIQQVLINLVLNALDAVTGLPPARRRVSISMELADSTITIEVQDRGAGIAPENLPRIFESFFTTKAEGMGLGLSIVRTIVDAHNGTISARNLKPCGAAFQIALPRLEHRPAPEEVT